MKVVNRLVPQLNVIDRVEMLDVLAKRLESQDRLTTFINNNLPKLSADIFEKSMSKGILGDTLINLLQESSRNRLAFLELLLSNGVKYDLDWFFDTITSGDGIDILVKSLSHHYDRLKTLTAQNIYGETEALYKNFWAATLQVRAVVVRNLLVPIAGISLEDEITAFNYVLDKTFQGDQEYSSEIRQILRANFRARSDYSRYFCLAALLAAKKASLGSNTIGLAAATFMDAMGPAYQKAGQGIGSHPSTPEEIRQDFNNLKMHADEPTRWDLFGILKKALPAGVFQQIEHIGRVVGSASFFISVHVTFKDSSDGFPRFAIIQLLRPYVQSRATFGFKEMERTNAILGSNSSMFDVFSEILRQAKLDAGIEGNVEISIDQLAIMQSLYRDARVTVNGRDYLMNTPDVYSHGSNYRIIEFMPGNHYLEQNEGPSRIETAQAILTFELNNILTGRAFDNDRHGGNVLIDGHTISHLDPGGMMLGPPTDKDLALIGKVLFASISDTIDGNNFVATLLNEIKMIRQQQGEVPMILGRLQRALLGLGDYFQDLEGKHLMDALISSIQGVHPSIRDVFLSHALNGGSDRFQHLLPLIIAPPIRIHRPN